MANLPSHFMKYQISASDSKPFDK